MDTWSMLLDVLLLLVMAALWWMWWQQNKHRKAIEASLFEASQQLQDATQLLDEALEQISHLQQSDISQVDERKAMLTEQKAPTAIAEPIAEVALHDDLDTGIHVEFSSQAREMSESKADVSRATSKMTQPSVSPPPQQTQATQILRMQREGETPETIASTLDIPLAQVKLLLMLQGSK